MNTYSPGLSSPCDPDLVLVARAQHGSRHAFDLLAARYQARLLALAGRYFSEPADAADVVQDALLRAWRSLATFRGGSTFYTWLYRIVANCALNVLATPHRRVRLLSLDAAGQEHLASSRLCREEDPAGLLGGARLQLRLDRALSRLPDELRHALTLRAYHGLRYQEIATILACPAGTVRSRIFRARALLMVALQEVIGIDTVAAGSSAPVNEATPPGSVRR